jgi:hypothetical protein
MNWRKFSTASKAKQLVNDYGTEIAVKVCESKIDSHGMGGGHRFWTDVLFAIYIIKGMEPNEEEQVIEW